MQVEASGQAVLRQTRITYDDANWRVTVRRNLNGAGDRPLVSVTAYDQLGRVRLTKQLEAAGENADDDQAGIKVHTRYLSDGTYQYQLTTNPFRSVSGNNEPTMGWTLTTFDRDGRTISVKTFEGAARGAEITGRVLEVAVPQGGIGAAQQVAINSDVSAAAKKGVQVIFVPIR